jgi:hypothetical protein
MDGSNEADLARDVLPVIAHKLTPEAWKTALGGIVAALTAAGYTTQKGNKLSATPAGKTAAAEFLGLKKQMPGSWAEARDRALVARALDLHKEPASRLKGLTKLDGLRGLIVLSVFGLKVRGAPSPSRLRSALAVIALERAFGNQIKHDLGGKPGLSARSGRLLAGQLAKKPKDFRTDARLVAALAVEAVGSQKSDVGALRLAILRRFVSGAEADAAVVREGTPKRAAAERKTKQRLGSRATPPPAPAPKLASPAPEMPRPVLANRPDPAGFAREVQAAARARAEGWPGNRKAFVSHVWQRLSEERPEWALTEIEFKCMLTEAHRTGLLTLANADLKNKQNLKDLQDSAISYKNTVWHFIRVPD